MRETDFSVRLPSNVCNLSKRDEYFFIARNGQERKLRVQDYTEIYKIPGLYEHLYVKMLHFQSPHVLSTLLVKLVTQAEVAVTDLVVLDLGAGVGLVGRRLAEQGVNAIVGIDIIQEAAEAAARNSPGMYEKYYVADLAALGEATRGELESRGFNCLVCSSALGVGHVLSQAFAQAFNLIATDGWIAFNLEKDFVESLEPTGVSQFLYGLVEKGILEICCKHFYQQRLSIGGGVWNGIAVIGRKRSSPSAFATP